MSYKLRICIILSVLFLCAFADTSLGEPNDPNLLPAYIAGGSQPTVAPPTRPPWDYAPNVLPKILSPGEHIWVGAYNFPDPQRRKTFHCHRKSRRIPDHHNNASSHRERHRPQDEHPGNRKRTQIPPPVAPRRTPHRRRIQLGYCRTSQRTGPQYLGKKYHGSRQYHPHRSRERLSLRCSRSQKKRIGSRLLKIDEIKIKNGGIPWTNPKLQSLASETDSLVLKRSSRPSPNHSVWSGKRH